MPVLIDSYSPPKYFSNGHIQTLFPFFWRKVKGVEVLRERIETPDGDFLDLDWSRVGSDKLLILSHGLEGSSEAGYILGMKRYFNERGWDTLAWNNRCCSGEVNRRERFYHSGVSDDLGVVVDHALSHRNYKSVGLSGFSMGANITLKYLGEKGSDVDSRIMGAATFSCPVDLKSCSIELGRPHNLIYLTNFLLTMKQKLLKKHRYTGLGHLDLKRALFATNFFDWDDSVTAALHDFKGADDYYHSCSSKNFIPEIKVPTLLVSAKNDPFLPQACYPFGLAKDHKHFHFEAPDHGGHVGFVRFNDKDEYWSETRAFDFLSQDLKSHSG